MTGCVVCAILNCTICGLLQKNGKTKITYITVPVLKKDKTVFFSFGVCYRVIVCVRVCVRDGRRERELDGR